MRILGIDPGYGILGWAIIECNLSIIDYGIITTDPGSALDERLLMIHTGLSDIIKTFKPESVAIERLFFAKNTKTALDVAKCIGAVLLSTKLAGLCYNEYSPSQVKTAITGYGRASKDQMQRMIMKIFRINDIPRPDDAADALAIAACHSFNIKNISRFGNSSKGRG